ncbi:hypothetical protein FIBSPDRAFT_866527 [Athelia psychrophila]|uniref:Uncharacterized protein n=1 Tax=Athelia psychrophila TaxID=1759441 RepID=A0A166ER53_9AGAM|nr:hypothetical protein FIBSPDRAFT_866527 [Fibularhizoctonia sp. CBS 109695]
MGVRAAQTAGLTLTLPSLGPGRSSPSSSPPPSPARIRLSREHLKGQRRPVPTSIPRLLLPQRRTERGGVLPHVRPGIRLGHAARHPHQRNSREGHARAASLSLALRRLSATAPGATDSSTIAVIANMEALRAVP